MKFTRSINISFVSLLLTILFLSGGRSPIPHAGEKGNIAAFHAAHWKKLHFKAAPSDQLSYEDGPSHKPLLVRRQVHVAHELIPATVFQLSFCPPVTASLATGGTEHIFIRQKQLLFPVHGFW